MRYVNQTKTTLELCDGDVLETDASLIAIGRDLNLAEALQHRAGARFRPFSSSEFSQQHVQIVRSADRKMAAIRTNFRPNRRSLINFEYEALREFANAITHLVSVTEMNHIAMAPVSCRVPDMHQGSWFDSFGLCRSSGS